LQLHKHEGVRSYLGKQKPKNTMTQAKSIIWKVYIRRNKKITEWGKA